MTLRPKTRTVRTPTENFTGDAYLDAVFNDDDAPLVVGLVRSTLGARTNCHSHANGQLLVCADGVGLVPAATGRPFGCAGESVWTPPGQEHWHGSTAETMMCHYAILDETPARDATTWPEPVTDE
jgi:quercetin dioxygenase-like cupin family protein